MARIRTIKPEFPQSESMGNVSRDARLLFIQLWTICDDSGRTRGNSRMLASLLFPYDEDASGLLDGWLDELEREGCIARYKVDGAAYIQVQKWQEHQRIDKPSPSKFPAFVESSRTFPEASRKIVQDQGPRTKDQGRDQGVEASRKNSRAPKAQRWPSDAIVPEDWIEDGHNARARNSLPPVDLNLEAQSFVNYWVSKPGKDALKLDWKRTWLNWCTNAKGKSHGSSKPTQLEQLASIARADTVFDD